MNVLITGACGLLGAHLLAALSRKHSVLGVDRHSWWGDQPAEILVGDLSEPTLAREAVAAAKPDVLIHCAAFVDVDACEQNPSDAYRMNSELTQQLVQAVTEDCLFVYITTDGIFKGDAPFQTENDLPCPRTVYGRSKLHGEWTVQLATPNHLIVRTNFYGWSSGRKRTSAEWLFGALKAKQPITLFDDFFFTPTYVVDLVERLNALIESRHRGLFHICGKDRVSKYKFGELVAAAAGYSMESVRQGSIHAARLPAARPKDMSLSSERFCNETGIGVPECFAGVRRFVGDHGVPLSCRFVRVPAIDPVDQVRSW